MEATRSDGPRFLHGETPSMRVKLFSLPYSLTHGGVDAQTLGIVHVLVSWQPSTEPLTFGQIAPTVLTRWISPHNAF